MRYNIAMPTLYLMLGYPGAGKTTAAKAIQELTGAVHVSSDEVRLEMFEKPDFSQTEHNNLYDYLDAYTEKLLREGADVIYDANLNRFQHRQDKYAICKRVGAKSVLVWVQTPKAIAKERATHIGRFHLVPQHETASQMFDRIADIIEEPGSDEPYISVDGTKGLKPYISKLLGA